MRTLSSTIGERWVPRPVIGEGSLELLKLVGVAAMVTEHAARYLDDARLSWPWYVGRLAFPLFAIALAVGVSAKSVPDLRSQVARMLPWAIAAAFACALVRDALPGNVIFTLALGVLLRAVLMDTRAVRFLIAVPILVAGFCVEFGPGGVLAVAMLCGWARQQGTVAGYVRFAIGLALMCAISDTFAPLLVAPLAWAVSQWGAVIPRIRRAFYVAYIGQWPILAALRGSL